MLYLVTGANGTGKTLLTLKHVKELADKESRPVCHNGRFDPAPDGPLKSWRKIDIKDWQAEPDGTIFFVDECHNDFPKRGTNEPTPEYVRMLAEHRKRGFDFFLISQHPMNIDAFVRRLIGNPGWHRHLKRVAGAQLVSQLQWDAVNPNCERPGSGDTGQVQMVPYPKEVYGWYHSAQLHTGKRAIPRAVWVALACAIAVPALGYVGWRSLMGNKALNPNLASPATAASGAVAVSPAQGQQRQQSAAPLTAQEYVASRTPRIPGLQFTAPAYDQVTAPKEAPFPAACLDGVKPGTKQRTCTCWSQQATMLPMEEGLCRQIAERGYFMDWKAPAAQLAPAAAVPPAASSAVVPPPAATAAAVLSSAARSVAVSGDGSLAAVAASEPQDRTGAVIRAMRTGQRAL